MDAIGMVIFMIWRSIRHPAGRYTALLLLDLQYVITGQKFQRIGSKRDLLDPNDQTDHDQAGDQRHQGSRKDHSPLTI